MRPIAVLLVNDSRDEGEMYAVGLAVYGFRTLQADNARDALHLIAREHPAVVVTDDVLAGGSDGFGLTTLIRADERIKDVPVVILTAGLFERDRETAEHVGSNLVIPKPCPPDALAERLDQLVRSVGRA